MPNEMLVDVVTLRTGHSLLTESDGRSWKY